MSQFDTSAYTWGELADDHSSMNADAGSFAGDLSEAVSGHYALAGPCGCDCHAEGSGHPTAANDNYNPLSPATQEHPHDAIYPSFAVEEGPPQISYSYTSGAAVSQQTMAYLEERRREQEARDRYATDPDGARRERRRQARRAIRGVTRTMSDAQGEKQHDKDKKNKKATKKEKKKRSPA